MAGTKRMGATAEIGGRLVVPTWLCIGSWCCFGRIIARRRHWTPRIVQCKVSMTWHLQGALRRHSVFPDKGFLHKFLLVCSQVHQHVFVQSLWRHWIQHCTLVCASLLHQTQQAQHTHKHWLCIDGRGGRRW